MALCHAPNYPTLFWKFLFVGLTSFTCSLLSSCTPEGTEAAKSAPVDTYFQIQLDNKNLHLQLTLTESEREQGLMFRSELGKDHGMLFLFETPDKRSFWMKNTSIPLDIGYFDARGRLLEVHQLYPFDETPVPSHSDQILIAIETNLGWFKANEVQPEAQLDMDALRSAVSDRGFNPSAYAISE